MTTSYNNLAPSLERLRLVKEAVHAVERQKGKSRLLISEEDEAALKCTLRAHAFQPKDPHGASTASGSSAVTAGGAFAGFDFGGDSRARRMGCRQRLARTTSGSSLGKPRGTSENQLRSEHRARKNTCPRCAPEVELFSSVPPMVFSNPDGHFYTKRCRSQNHPALHLRA